VSNKERKALFLFVFVENRKNERKPDPTTMLLGHRSVSWVAVVVTVVMLVLLSMVVDVSEGRRVCYALTVAQRNADCPHIVRSCLQDISTIYANKSYICPEAAESTFCEFYTVQKALWPCEQDSVRLVLLPHSGAFPGARQPSKPPIYSDTYAYDDVSPFLIPIYFWSFFFVFFWVCFFALT
jgi:hypothetical protein